MKQKQGQLTKQLRLEFPSSTSTYTTETQYSHSFLQFSLFAGATEIKLNVIILQYQTEYTFDFSVSFKCL